MEENTRHLDRVAADVECLMCGRLIGELFGLLWRVPLGRPTARSIANLTTFRAATPGVPWRRVTASERFRCPWCGGFGMVGEVSISVLVERLPDTSCPVHGEQTSRAGRPPRGCRCLALRAAA